MRNFNEDFAAELLSETAFFANFLELQLTIPFYCNSSDIDIYYDENTYLAIPFGFTDIQASSTMSVDKVTVSLGNADLTMSALLLAEDVRNKVAIVSMGAIGDNHKVIALESIFTGYVDSYLIQEDKVTITVTNEFVLWNKKVLRTQTASCPWDFVTDGSGECKYSGSGTWCDKSYSRCSSLNNTDNFGGFRFAPAVADKQVWWGKVPA